MMQVVAVENADAVKVYAASRIVRGVESGRIKVLGVATGTLPIPLYRMLKTRRTPALRFDGVHAR